MNTSHYPSLDLCKKLTANGFPRTEMWLLDFWYDRANQWDIMPYDFCLDCEDYEWTTYRCPSIAELLDELPEWMIEFERIGKEWKIWYWYEDENPHIIYSINLPNALAEMYLWLKENNYLTK